MPSAAAARARRRRARRAQGREVLHVEVEYTDLTEALIDRGELQAGDAEDREQVARAVEQLLAAIVARDRI